ncbi:hypothetical protein [Solobacterium sp.]|uniref:virion core protein, T7 gp14 family n=1 Tax=Solobacterium sp. TaxID=2060878 RepID=UPI001CB53A3B|nr:hypothetical protein [Solobacterium sp.]MBF1085086.1 hypothetical protein [Solobacterium sp.]
MCNPIALTAASMVGTLFTQHQQGKAQAAMYAQQARVAEANARISDRKQEQIADQALQERDKMSDKMRLIQGQNTAETGASGLMMAGTPLQLMASSYDEYNKDIQNWENNKNNSIYNEYLNGMNYRNEASTARAAASNAKKQTRMAMLGTILSGASSIYGLKGQYASKSAGVGNNYYTPASDALEAAGMPKMKFVTKGTIRNNRWGI